MRGIRDKSELAEFEISRRLTARLGAFLLKKIEVSPAVIEAAAPGTALEKFLLRPALMAEITPDSLKKEAADAKLAEDEGLSLVLAESEEGWRIIALEEEVLAEQAWGKEPAGEAKAEQQPLAVEERKEARPLAKRPAVERVETAPGGIFSPERLDQLKVTLVASADPQAKIEALRLLCYSPITPEDKTELLVQAEQDASAEVRAEAATLTAAVGADAGAAESLRALAAGDEANRTFAAERLGVYAREGRGAQAVFAVTALVAALRHDASAPVRKACLKSLEDSAGFLAANERRAVELMRMLLVHLARDFTALAYPVRRLLMRLAEYIPAVVEQVLWEEAGATPDRRVRVMLLTMLGDLKGVDAKRLAKAMAEECARPEEKTADFRSFSTYLHALGTEGARALVAVYPTADRSQRKNLIRLMDDICRYGKVSAEVKEEVAGLFRKHLSGASRDLRMTIMTTHLAADRELSEETRRELARLFVENVQDVRMATDIDNVEYTISRMGLAAVEPLLERLNDTYPDGERIRAARLLGDLGRNEGFMGGEAAAKPLEGLLRTLKKRLIDGFPEPGELLVAESKIASTPPIERRAVDMVARAVLERLDKQGPDAHTYEALGWVASSARVNQAFLRRAIKALCDMLDSPEAEIAPESRVEGDIKIFELGPEAGYYTDLLPAAMKGLELIYTGHRKGAGLRRTIAGFLIRKWQEITTGKRFWGPGNVTEMVAVLKRVASHPDSEPETRISILKALGKKLYNIPVMLAVGEILAADDSPGDMASMASAVAVALLKLRDNEGRFSEDERQEVLEVLGKIVRRRNLDVTTPGTERLRETLVETLFSGLRDNVPGVYDALAALRSTDWLDPQTKRSINDRLADYESIVPYAPA